MEKTKLFECFNTHFDYIKKSAFPFAIWSDTAVDKDVCKMIARYLTMMADEAKDKNAAALYCLITAYDNHGGTFSPETACRLVFEHDAVDTYLELLEKEFGDIVDECFYEEMKAFPALKLMEFSNSLA